MKVETSSVVWMVGAAAMFMFLLFGSGLLDHHKTPCDWQSVGPTVEVNHENEGGPHYTYQVVEKVCNP